MIPPSLSHFLFPHATLPAPCSPTYLSLLAAPVPPLLHVYFTSVSVKSVEDVLLRWLRRSPPPQAQESTEEPAPRSSLPDFSQSRSQIPKLLQLRQLQVRLHRLPDNILRPSVCTPAQLGQIAARCALTRPAFPQTQSPDQPKTPTPPAPHQPPCPLNNILTTQPKSLQSDLGSAPLSPRPLRIDSQGGSPCQVPTSPTHSIYSLLFHQVKDRGPKPPTLAPHRLPQSAGTSLRASKQLMKPTANEEAEGPVSGKMVKNSPRTDSEYVLRSQNSAESASANSQTGLTNGVPHKGLLQSKHKIRVDFKVSLCVFVALPCPHPIPIKKE